MCEITIYLDYVCEITIGLIEIRDEYKFTLGFSVCEITKQLENVCKITKLDIVCEFTKGTVSDRY